MFIQIIQFFFTHIFIEISSIYFYHKYCIYYCKYICYLFYQMLYEILAWSKKRSSLYHGNTIVTVSELTDCEISSKPYHTQSDSEFNPVYDIYDIKLSAIVFLVLVTFWLPPQSETKISVATCTILIIAVFLVYFGLHVPLTANPPLIGRLMRKPDSPKISSIIFNYVLKKIN